MMIIETDQSGRPELTCVPDAHHQAQELDMAKKKAAASKTRKVIKSADDGQFKSKGYAKTHPKTTYKQSVTPKSPKKK